MSERIKLVRNDTRPTIVVDLKDRNTGEAINVSTSTVRMYFRKTGDPTIVATLNGSLLPGFTNEYGQLIVDSPYNVAGVGGRCSFNWTPTSLTGDPGLYEGEIEITFADTTVQTVFDLVKFRLRDDF
jgi:hypothetical protein